MHDNGRCFQCLSLAVTAFRKQSELSPIPGLAIQINEEIL